MLEVEDVGKKEPRKQEEILSKNDKIFCCCYMQ